MSADTTSSWINSRRLRVHGTILALCLWSVYVWNVSAPGLLDRNGNLKGTDFSHLYTLGSVGLAHSTADLYDADAQAELTARRIPPAAGIRYIPMYPPQVSIFFAPLAALPYCPALVIWLVLSALVYGLCCYALWQDCPRLRNQRWTVLLLAIAFPGFFHLIVWGQTSAIALACFTAAFFFLREGNGSGNENDNEHDNARPFLAGLALGCLIFKPQLGLAAAVVFAYTRAWRVLAGAILSAAAQLALPAIYYGPESLRAWLRTMRGVISNVSLLEPKAYQSHNLRMFWTMLVPGQTLPLALYVLSALLILGLTVALWSRQPAAPLALRFSSLLLASVLVAPHLIVYDLVILAPVFLLLADWMISRAPSLNSNMKVVLYFVYLSPLAGGPIARWTHLQISAVLMSVLVWMIWQVWDSGAGALKVSQEKPVKPPAR